MEKIEQVLVVNQAEIEPLLDKPFGTKNLEEILDLIEHRNFFMDRPGAETNPAFKQIIPYVLVKYQENYLLLQRTKKQGEARLHGKKSLGVGGHINPHTVPINAYASLVEYSLYRELVEEIKLREWNGVSLTGVIYDDSNDVGKVHVGLVYILDTSAPDFEVGEPDMMTARWANVPELTAEYDGMENWSKIVFDRLIRGTIKTSTP